ncbi:TRAP transporter small permease subunit [Sneathiella glossodoripedis]|uniref:TRAP transporter small permease subunit n=1 Tax=Sneathiella glossodoripedis TaxID=418853 RepID=UPI000471DD1F|nr:TRAP transporter small permease [Sneathiella glossodoripedis]
MYRQFVDRLSQCAAVLSCVILVMIVSFILLEITLRSFFNSSTYVLDEFVGYGVAAMTFLAFAATLRDGVFIRVEMILAHLSPQPRRAVEVLSLLVGTALFSGLTWYVAKLIYRNFDRGVVSNSIAEIPLWIPQSFILAGLVLLVLQFVAQAISVALGADYAGMEGAKGASGHD